MTDRLPDEPLPTPETFGELYQLLAASPTYRRITVEVFGEGYGVQLSGAAPADVRLLATRAALERGQRVADFCCGLGGPTLLLASEYGCQMLAVDWSRQAVLGCRTSAGAAQLDGSMRFVVADVSASPFGDATLDAVVSIDGFYFGVDLPALYAEVYRLLVPGGRFAFYFDVPSQEVVDASPPSRRAHRESHRIDHLGALATAGFIHARAEDRTAAQQLLLGRMVEAYELHFEDLRADIGVELAEALRDEIRETLHMSEHGWWPRYLFSARKPDDRPARRR
ncbi:MAG TPA: methyltransferase domain-containing protein [Chloroflexia bacterium]|nr:methyltransferase domain-containing protein [Chloroflexia bacterium]